MDTADKTIAAMRFWYEFITVLDNVADTAPDGHQIKIKLSEPDRPTNRRSRRGRNSAGGACPGSRPRGPLPLPQTSR